MEKITLEFISPTKLNELKDGESAEKKCWSYEGLENGTLVLDTQSWTISCEDNSQNASINKWLVNEDTHSMKIGNPDEITDGFKALDYPFAVSMIGQLCESKDLMGYLQSLQNVFNVGRKPDSFDTERKTE